MTGPTKEQLLADPCSPFWALEVLRASERLDPIDYVNGLEVLLAEARQRLEDAQLQLRRYHAETDSLPPVRGY